MSWETCLVKKMIVQNVFMYLFIKELQMSLEKNIVLIKSLIYLIYLFKIDTFVQQENIKLIKIPFKISIHQRILKK